MTWSSFFLAVQQLPGSATAAARKLARFCHVPFLLAPAEAAVVASVEDHLGVALILDVVVKGV